MLLFFQCVVSALYCTGFAESVTETFSWDNVWAVRGVAIGTLLLLLAINLAGNQKIFFSTSIFLKFDHFYDIALL